MGREQESYLVDHLRTLISRQRGWNDKDSPTRNEVEPFAGELSRHGTLFNTTKLLSFWRDKRPDPDEYRDIIESLARNQGYENWQEFLDTHQMPLYVGEVTQQNPKENSGSVADHPPRYRKYMWFLLVMNLMLLALVVLLIILR